MSNKTQYRGVVEDRMSDAQHTTKTHTTWEAAHHAAEALCNRRYGRGNDRYGIRVELRNDDGQWEAG
jgi:hypothetical protein